MFIAVLSSFRRFRQAAIGGPCGARDIAGIGRQIDVGHGPAQGRKSVLSPPAGIFERIGELLRQLRGTGATVLIAEQNVHFCLGLASHATVIDKGQIVYTCSIEELKANDNIR
jgi:hypothetical protein